MYALEFAELVAPLSQLNIIKHQPTHPPFILKDTFQFHNNDNAGIVSESVHEEVSDGEMQSGSPQRS